VGNDKRKRAILEQIDRVEHLLKELEARIDRLDRRKSGTLPEETRYTEVNLMQQAYTRILEHFVESGRAPHFTELASMLVLSLDEARVVQREAAEAGVGCWIRPETDIIESWAPFSNIPTQYLVTVEGEQKWYAQ
jgi:hypothetical protein